MCCEGLIEKLPETDSCCCCCKVETGSKVIAWLGAIGSFLYTITLIFAIVALSAGLSHAKDDAKNQKALITVGILISVILLLYLVFFWVMALLLLIGLYKDDMDKVRTWLKVNMCLFIFGTVAQILNMISVCTSGAPVGNIVSSVISAIIGILINFYILCVIKSHYVNKTQGFSRGP